MALVVTGCASVPSQKVAQSQQKDLSKKTEQAEDDNLRFKAEITVNQPIDETFQFVTNFENAIKISKNLTIDDSEESKQNSNMQYKRVLDIHGFDNNQIVTASISQQNYSYITNTELFGVKISHNYKFTKINDQTVKISLEKHAIINNWVDRLLKPFIQHQLTRPEHDGNHLAVLKTSVESSKVI